MHPSLSPLKSQDEINAEVAAERRQARIAAALDRLVATATVALGLAFLAGQTARAAGWL